MTGDRRDGQDKSPGQRLHMVPPSEWYTRERLAADPPEYTPEERKIGCARLVFLQALIALQENDPDAADFLSEVFTPGGNPVRCPVSPATPASSPPR